MHEQIAVGVRRGHVAVLNLLACELHRAVTARGLRRSPFLRQRGHAAGEADRRVHRIAHHRLRLLVREDGAAALPHRFIRAGLIGMPVRVDQHLDTAGFCRAPDLCQ